MRMRSFAIPVHDSADAQAELDRFVTSHRVIELDRHLISDGMRSTWAICVTYVDTEAAGTSTTKRSESKAGKRGVDYRDVLSPEDFDDHRPCGCTGLSGRRAASSPAARRLRHRPATIASGAGQTGENRVNRGGSWNDHARNVRAAYRNGNHPGNRNQDLGLRLVRAQARGSAHA